MRKEPIFTEKDFSKPFAEENKLKVLFPGYREKYIEQTSSYIKMALERKKLACEIDLKEKFIEVSTTKKTRDPFIFIKGCEFVRLVCKCVEVEVAMKVLGENYCGELIDIRKMVKSEKVFEKRRDRLIAGKVVAVVGTYDGLSVAKQVITGCMNNIHPVYEIKKMIIKKKLSEDPSKKDEDWSKYMPEMKKTHQKKSKMKVKAKEAKEKKKLTKVETGECFVEENDAAGEN